MRLNKYIASCGFSSRRGADSIISEGRVTVNGQPVITMGMDINPSLDLVSIDGTLLTQEVENVYIMLNKPASVLSSCSDDRGRKTVLDLLTNVKQRVYPVGRLDFDTEGLLLLTNDGLFAYQCTHPKHELNKTYDAIIHGRLDDAALTRLQSGIELDGIKTSSATIKILHRSEGKCRLTITIHEGRNRQVKRMFESVGCHVKSLKRTAVGNLTLDGLEVGQWRYLSPTDFKLIGMAD